MERTVCCAAAAGGPSTPTTAARRSAMTARPQASTTATASASRAIRNQFFHAHLACKPPCLRAKNAHIWIIFARNQGVHISQGDICP